MRVENALHSSDTNGSDMEKPIGVENARKTPSKRMKESMLNSRFPVVSISKKENIH